MERLARRVLQHAVLERASPSPLPAALVAAARCANTRPPLEANHVSRPNREASDRSIGHREAIHTRSREVRRIAVPEEVDRIAGRQDLVRSRDQQAAPRRKQRQESHNHAHKMRRESRPLRQMRKW